MIQNLAIAGAAIVATSIPAAAGLFPLWLAVFLHEGSTVLVAINSLRALRMPRGTAFAPPASLNVNGAAMAASPATAQSPARV